MNLAEGLQEEIKRCQELVIEYDRLGAVGQIGKMLIQSQIDQAIKVSMEGDVIAMMQSYEELKGCE